MFIKVAHLKLTSQYILLNNYFTNAFYLFKPIKTLQIIKETTFLDTSYIQVKLFRFGPRKQGYGCRAPVLYIHCQIIYALIGFSHNFCSDISRKYHRILIAVST